MEKFYNLGPRLDVGAVPQLQKNWKSQFSTAQNIVTLLSDISWFDNLNRKVWYITLERMTPNLCNKLHTETAEECRMFIVNTNQCTEMLSFSAPLARF